VISTCHPSCDKNHKIVMQEGRREGGRKGRREGGREGRRREGGKKRGPGSNAPSPKNTLRSLSHYHLEETALPRPALEHALSMKTMSTGYVGGTMVGAGTTTMKTIRIPHPVELGMAELIE
jgi:hypothetical protein